MVIVVRMGLSSGLSGSRGVSPIVGQILLIGLIVVAMTGLAIVVVQSAKTSEPRYVDLEVQLENLPPNHSDSVKVILKHVGGESLGIPDGPNDEFRVIGRATLEKENVGGSWVWENPWENRVAWDNWVFSNPKDGFELGENAVGVLRHDNALINTGDRIKINIVDLYADELIFSRTITVKSSE